MSAAVIRYRTKPETADENQRLIENVFAELAETGPDGLTYASFRLADGVTFVHVVSGEDDAVTRLTAFKEFQRTLGARLEVGPDREDAGLIGRYAG